MAGPKHKQPGAGKKMISFGGEGYTAKAGILATNIMKRHGKDLEGAAKELDRQALFGHARMVWEEHGDALVEKSKKASGDERKRLLRKAVRAFENARNQEKVVATAQLGGIMFRMPKKQV